MQLLVNISLVRVASTDVVWAGLAISESIKDEYVKSREFEMSVSMSY